MIPTDEQLRAWKEAAEKATPGPWHTGHLGDDSIKCDCRYVFDENHMGSVAVVSLDDGANDCPKKDKAVANMKFIAISREAVPRLIAAVEELKAENEKWRKDTQDPKWLALRASVALGVSSFLEDMHLSQEMEALYLKIRATSHLFRDKDKP